MTKIYYIALLLLSNLAPAQAVEGIIIYKAIKGYGDQTELSEKAKKPNYFKYTFSNQKSLQELISKETTTKDTTYIDGKSRDAEKLATTQTVIRNHRAIYYKDFKANIYRLELSKKNAELINSDISIEDKIPKYEWIIENEFQTISGFNCNKATTTRTISGRTQKIIAWFNEEIPITDGPMDFNGLPGLILQVEINGNTLVKFEKLKLTSNKTIEIKKPENLVQLLTIQEYFNKKK
ncbi:GLPGLI family protein [Aestuariibaculum marinum]|uniref:GLPGLI family protein n=1 Tax=Aestuariibaculum marinum TaxID=2683592 RepID=A0A8J6Q1Q4_9FLAO|nr:GLPGLI family protein [Aestuariibaculum marinum]MBD0824610.1 GLPGLI family protein [Aestuariibaculum marinum]